MGNDESNYNRFEDQEWRKTVETRLVSLTSAQKTTDDDLDKHTKLIEELDELLEGDPLKRDDSGLKGDVKDLSRGLNELRSIMAPDALGHGGVKNRLDACERALGLRVQTSENRWKVVLAIISATAIVTSAVVANIDRISVSLKKFWTHDIVSESKPQRKHTGKMSKRRLRPAVTEAPTEATDGAKEGMSDGRSGDGGDTK